MNENNMKSEQNTNVHNEIIRRREFNADMC
jgi:hypothetical protein